MDLPVLDHRSSRTGRWVRGRRGKLAVWIAVVEGVLVVFGVVPTWVALAVAVLVIAFYVGVGRNLASDTGRQLIWVAALSQVVVALVPLLVFLVGALAIAAVVALALFGLAALLADRR